MGEYDRTMKSLVDNDPEALARFVLHEWQRQRRTVLSEVKITAVKQLNSEFQGRAEHLKSSVRQVKRKANKSKSESESEELTGDSVLLVEGPKGPLYLIELEFQSNLHPYMPVRSLEYLARAMKKHKVCSDLPVIAAVIYLFDEEGMPHSPLVWPAPAEQSAMVFHYLSIQMKEIPREQFLALREPTLWPLALLTAGPVNRIIVEQMFAELLEEELYDTLTVGCSIASWLLDGEDLDWFEEECQNMHEFLEDSPFLGWMRERITQKEAYKAQQQAEQKMREELKLAEQKMREKFGQAEQRMLEAQKQKEQRMLEVQKRKEQKMLEVQKQKEQKMLEERTKMLEAQKRSEQRMLTMNREMVAALVSERFPTLLRMAKANIRTLKQPELFQQVIVRLSLARDVDEAQEVLFSLLEKEESEDEEDK